MAVGDIKKIFTAILFFSFAFAGDIQSILDQSKSLKLHEDPYWSLLLRYKKGIFKRLGSEVDGHSFFLSKNGKHNAQDELIKTIEGMFEENENDHVFCRFPARSKWIISKLGIDDESLPKIKCDHFVNWKESIRPKSISLVFASAYFNNPASTFGHTLIKLNKEVSGQEQLDYTVNYAANTPPNPGIMYAIWGLTGVYPGVFSTHPYYFKLVQYNEVEQRDLWEYKLNFTKDEIETMLDHLWEVGHTHFNYYFIDENCSYHILGLLDVARSHLNFQDKFQFFTAPTDTVKYLSQSKNLIESMSYRPSKRSRFYQLLVNLNNKQIKTMNEIALKNKLDSSKVYEAQVLDTAIEYLSIKYKKPNTTDFQKRLLELRSAVDEHSVADPNPQSTPPHLGHKSSRFGLGYGLFEDDQYVSINLRGAYHDVLSNSMGYPKLGQIEMMSTNLRFYIEEKKLWLEHLNIVNVVSYAPLNKYFSQPSWNVQFGMNTLNLQKCSRCSVFSVQAGPGFSLAFQSLTFFSFLNVHALISPWNNLNFDLGLRPSAGFLIKAINAWSFDLSSEFSYYGLNGTHDQVWFKTEHRIDLIKNLEFRMQAKWTRQVKEYETRLLLYF